MINEPGTTLGSLFFSAVFRHAGVRDENTGTRDKTKTSFSSLYKKGTACIIRPGVPIKT